MPHGDRSINVSAARMQIIHGLVAIVGTGVAFAFLEAGAFRDFGDDTLRRMLAPEGLRAAALGASVTGVLLVPVLVWKWRSLRAGDSS